MSTDTRLWHLYCVKTQERSGEISAEEALKRVKTLADDAWPNWFAWTEGYADWVPIAQCELFTASRDRRRYPRVQIRVVVTVFAGYQKFQTVAKDISIGGILLDRELPFKPLNPKVKVQLKYADLSGQPIEFSARLIMDRERPIRMEFTGGEARCKKRLNDWVSMAIKRKDEAA